MVAIILTEISWPLRNAVAEINFQHGSNSVLEAIWEIISDKCPCTLWINSINSSIMSILMTFYLILSMWRLTLVETNQPIPLSIIPVLSSANLVQQTNFNSSSNKDLSLHKIIQSSPQVWVNLQLYILRIRKVIRLYSAIGFNYHRINLRSGWIQRPASKWSIIMSRELLKQHTDWLHQRWMSHKRMWTLGLRNRLTNSRPLMRLRPSDKILTSRKLSLLIWRMLRTSNNYWCHLLESLISMRQTVHHRLS